MLFYAIAIFCGLILRAIAPLPLVKRFVQFLQMPPDKAIAIDLAEDLAGNLAEKSLPKVAVILCLRGADPFLAQCLQALMQQDYGNYELQIVVDRREDPAWQVVTEVIGQYPSVKVKVNLQPLQNRYQHCSLKCSAVIQAISDLESDCEAIAFLDGDTVPFPTWLRELVLPLCHPDVGATTGYRWYLPEFQQDWGAWVRAVWNSLAVAQMSILPPVFPWGGSCAIKTQVVHQVGLLDRWQYSLSKDTSMDQALRAYDIAVIPVPSLMMVNREDCDLRSFCRWVERQLLMSKLYNTCWGFMLMDSVLTVALLCMAIAGLLVASLTQQWQAVIWLAGGLGGYVMILLLLLLWMEKGVRQVVWQRGERLPRASVAAMVKRVLVILPTQFILAGVSLRAHRAKQIQWRGITYSIQDPHNVEFEYAPYQPINPSTRASII